MDGLYLPHQLRTGLNFRRDADPPTKPTPYTPSSYSRLPDGAPVDVLMGDPFTRDYGHVAVLSVTILGPTRMALR
jgi:hypothetical protein